MIIQRTNLRYLSYRSARNLSMIVILICSACKSEKTLDAKRFQEVLFKIHECEAYNELKYENKNQTFLENCKNSVFKESNVSADIFYNTVEKYKSNSVDFEKMYDTLIYQSESKSIN
jgi:hypothetical protein